MKFTLRILLVLLLVTGLIISCGNTKNPTTDNSANTSKENKTITTSKEDVPGVIKIIVNPNQMNTEGKPRSAQLIASMKKKIEEGSEKIVAYAKANDEQKLINLVNNARKSDSEIKEYIPQEHLYIGLQKRINDTWKIAANGTNIAYVGVDVVLDAWEDLTKWKYHVDTFKQGTNRVWIDNYYWKDQEWAGNKLCRQAGYTRLFTVNNTDYWLFWGIWLDE